MKNPKSVAVLLSSVLFFCGCFSPRVQAPTLHQRPVGFWENEGSVVQVLHTYQIATMDFTENLEIKKVQMLSTGIVVNVNGMVFTNHHAVTATNLAENTFYVPDSDKIEVCKVLAGIPDCLEANLVNTDIGHDFALLTVKQLFDRPVTFIDDHSLKLGAEVYLWGNIQDWAPPSPMVGRFVNWIAEPYVKQENFGAILLPLLIVDISFQEGSSGGPTFDSLGRCVGQNRFFTTAGGRSLAASTPSSDMMKFLDDNNVSYKVEK